MKTLVLLSAVVMLGLSSCTTTCPAYSQKDVATEAVSASATPAPASTQPQG